LNAYSGAFFGVGGGVNVAALHHPDYDFPDDIILPAVTLAVNVLQRALDEASS
jgi:hypothetical protein